LQIIAVQPVEAKKYWNAPTLEQELNGWIKGVTSYFDCLRGYLMASTRVELDDGDRKEARLRAMIWLYPELKTTTLTLMLLVIHIAVSNQPTKSGKKSVLANFGGYMRRTISV
jgi:hypothetical protein